MYGLGVAFDLLNATGQGCLHKAAQRGHTTVCEWLLGPEVGLLNPAKPTAALHAGLNRCEGSAPAELAKFGGHTALARWLEKQCDGVATAT